MNLRELIETTAAATGAPIADVRHRARIQREAGLHPKGRPGPGGGAVVTAHHAARLIVGIISTEPAIESAHAVRRFQNAQGGSIEVDCTESRVESAVRQLLVDCASDFIHKPREQIDDFNAGAMFLGGAGRQEILPASSFVDAVAHLIEVSSTEDASVPWLFVRRVGVTRSASGPLYGWLEMSPALPRDAVHVGSESLVVVRELFDEDGKRPAFTEHRVIYVDPKEHPAAWPAPEAQFAYPTGGRVMHQSSVGIDALRAIGRSLIETKTARRNGIDEPQEDARATDAPTSVASKQSAEHKHQTRQKAKARASGRQSRRGEDEDEHATRHLGRPTAAQAQ